MILLLCVGCGKPDSLDDAYGRRRGTPGRASVNGTAVLAGMFQRAGHRVFTTRRLSPRLDRADVIVWVPDDFKPPTKEVMAYLEAWLRREPDRTLVYVGRDFDAAVAYWRKMLARAPADQALQIKRGLAVKQSEYDAARRAIPNTYDGPWLTTERDVAPRQVRTLRGPWSDGVDAAQVEIRLRSRMGLPRWADVGEGVGDEDGFVESGQADCLLASDEDVLVSRICRRYGIDGQVIVVASGAFLLNMPLVNHQHRILAGRLIQECGPPGQSVAFLESGPAGVAISSSDNEMHHLLRAFSQWPINCILFHLTMLGIVYCISVFPIFGRPRNLPPAPQSDFGKHVDALGGLMQRSGDRQFARLRLTQYLQTVRGDPAKAHDRDRAGDTVKGE